jgi:hypothetical protein
MHDWASDVLLEPRVFRLECTLEELNDKVTLLEDMIQKRYP